MAVVTFGKGRGEGMCVCACAHSRDMADSKGSRGTFGLSVWFASPARTVRMLSRAMNLMKIYF